MKLAPTPLQGHFVRLEPFSEAVKAPLGQALDCDPDTWAIFSADGRGPAFESYWRDAAAASARGERIAFVVLDAADGRVLGTSSFLAVDPRNRSVEIGATFLIPEVRGGPVNVEVKRLMLGAAFEAGAERVQFQVDARNRRSQAAVAKLGAAREGVLRRHKVTWTGHVRDTVVFSIIAEEWPRVREGLDRRLAAFGSDQSVATQVVSPRSGEIQTASRPLPRSS